MAGSARIVIRVIEAPMIPLAAARRVQMTTVVIAIPPRRGPKMMYIESNRSSAAPDRSSIAPMKMNKGIEV